MNGERGEEESWRSCNVVRALPSVTQPLDINKHNKGSNNPFPLPPRTPPLRIPLPRHSELWHSFIPLPRPRSPILHRLERRTMFRHHARESLVAETATVEWWDRSGGGWETGVRREEEGILDAAALEWD